MSPVDERYCTIKEIAHHLGLKYWQIQRAVKSGTLPSYHLGESRRKLLLLSEVRAAISRTGLHSDMSADGARHCPDGTTRARAEAPDSAGGR